jgi:hypothetical protein
MNLIKQLIQKEREYVSQFMNTDSMSDYEIDKMFDELIKNEEKEERIKKIKKHENEREIKQINQ